MAFEVASQEGALKAGADAVNTAHTDINRHIAKVRGEIDQLRGFWTGAAATSFTGLMTRWDGETRKLNDVLTTLEEALRGTERDQIASEESHQATIANLAGGMNG